MPVQEPSTNTRAEAAVAANRGGGSRLKAPVAPDPARNNRIKVKAATKVWNPRDFVHIQALPGLSQDEGKVLSRSRTIYRSSQPLREQVFWENYHRRQQQFTQGHFTPFGKPYQELGEILYTDPKKLTLYALGQLVQEQVKKDLQEKPAKGVAEVTAHKDPLDPQFDSIQSDQPEPVKMLSPFRQMGKELKTLSKALARSRHHINRVKQGKEYFHMLHQESLEGKNMPKAAQQGQDVRWRTEFQEPKFPDVGKSEEEINSRSPTEADQLKKSGNTKKITLRSFTPVYSSVLIPSPPEAKSEHLFQQLCAIHWLLEALTLEPNSSMHSILTCWNPVDPGGCKKTVKEIEEEKIVTSTWKHFVTSTKKFTWKAQYSPLIRKMKRMSLSGISQLSGPSSPSGQSSRGSRISIALGSVTPSDVMSESAAAKEQQTLLPSLQKVTQITPEAVSEDVHTQEGSVKMTGLQRSSRNISSFIKSKSTLRANTRQMFIAAREEAACCLHDTLVSLERSQEKRCRQKYQALKQVKHFRRDMERVRQLGKKPERERGEDGLNWFSILLARLPESVKSHRCVQKILKKLEKHGKTPSLKIHPDTFLKALADLQVWELCSPQIAAAVEKQLAEEEGRQNTFRTDPAMSSNQFVRENIVRMPEEDFNEWFQARVAPLNA